MKNAVFIPLLILILSGCLRNDVLDDELLGTNFQESEFYTSGRFENDLDLAISNLIMDRVANNQGDTVCVPDFKFTLPPDYVQSLSEEWEGNLRLLLIKGQGPAQTEIEYILSQGEYGAVQSIRWSSVSCSRDTLAIPIRLELTSQGTSQVSALATTEVVIDLP